MIFFSIIIVSILFLFMDQFRSEYEWQKSGPDWHLTKESFSSKFRERENPSKIKKILKDTRIVFIGDSLMRYQYLNFIHILHTNSWLLSSFPHLELENNWYLNNTISVDYSQNYFRKCNHYCGKLHPLLLTTYYSLRTYFFFFITYS